MSSTRSKAPSMKLDPAKERKKYQENLREIEQLKSLGRTLDTNQHRRLVEKDMEIRQYLEVLGEVDNSTALQQYTTDATQSKGAALESQVFAPTQRNKALEEEKRKTLYRERQKATELDKRRKHCEFAVAEIETLKTDFAKEREDIAVLHAREKEIHEQKTKQMNKTIEKMKETVEKNASQLAKAKASVEKLTKQLEESKRTNSELQRLIESEDLGWKWEELLVWNRWCFELEERWKTLQESCAKLEIEKREKHEERKRLAAGLADLLLRNGHKLEAFLNTMEPELLCPITYELPQSPVLAADGWTYEREAITRWQTESGSATSPMPGAELCSTNFVVKKTNFVVKKTKRLATNFVVKKMIALLHEWKSKGSAETA